MRFMLRWFYKFFSVNVEDCTLSVLINEIHKKREKLIREYWLNYLEISSTQFRSITFIESKQKKVYDNHNNHYGVLRIRILKSREKYYKVMGLIEGLLAK